MAVAIKGDEGFSYAEALKKARTEISLKEIGIKMTKIRRAANGGIIIEIPGVENNEKANTLARKLKQVLPDEARITRPNIKGELRVDLMNRLEKRKLENSSQRSAAASMMRLI